MDAKFAQKWDDIVEAAIEAMEAEACRRAVEGWREREIFDNDGEPIGEVHKFSDALLMFMLRARRPDVYREHHRVELAGSEVPIRAEIVAVDARERSDAAREYLARIAKD